MFTNETAPEPHPNRTRTALHMLAGLLADSIAVIYYSIHLKSIYF